MARLSLHYYNMSPEVVAFTTTRHGGVSQGAYASLNLNPFCGDADAHVVANRQLLAAELGLDACHILMPHQVHGVDSRMVAAEFFGLPQAVQTMLLDGADIIMTAERGVCIGVSTADCIPVLLYDADHHAAAAVHAGWRGAVASICQKAIVDLRQSYDTDPTKLQAVIGPGISVDAFEVGDEVYAQFEQRGFDMDKVAVRTDKWHIDLKAVCRMQLEQMGVPAEAISDCGICTHTQHDDYFSARRLGVESGRLYTAIMLK